MPSATKPFKVAILDDYQRVALKLADWSAVEARASIDVFSDTITDPDALVARLLPYDVICVMRERTPLSGAIIDRLPNLKMIASTGAKNSSIDTNATQARNIPVENTKGGVTAPIELTWALIQASARHVTFEAAALRAGGWQTTVGDELKGRTLGILGLGRIGSKIARVARLFDMKVITWSDRVTEEKAGEAGAEIVTKDELFARSDILTIHLVLVDATRGIVGADELAQMKPTAWLVNTSRGEIIDEKALVRALQAGKLAGVALDVFGTEPLPADHPFRTLPNVVATPHLGYVSRQQYRVFYGDSARSVAAWLEQQPAAS